MCKAFMPQRSIFLEPLAFGLQPDNTHYFGGSVRTKDTALCTQSFSSSSASSAADKTIIQPFIGRPVKGEYGTRTGFGIAIIVKPGQCAGVFMDKRQGIIMKVFEFASGRI